MPKKTETVTVRLTEQKRQELLDWAEEHGMTEADALREMINRCVYDQRRFDEITQDEELKERLESLEQEVRELDRVWWKRLFR
jgi:predicted DNA-binding protein